jgi:hypothetical protein
MYEHLNRSLFNKLWSPVLNYYYQSACCLEREKICPNESKIPN